MGVISGLVTKGGSPVSGARVCASVGGLMSGGVTNEVRTDAQGRFTLQWSSATDAEKVFCEGREVLRNIRNGTNNVHIAL